VSKYIKNQFLDGLNVGCKKVFVLHNGVHRKLTKFPKKKKEVLFVGRIVTEKGVDLYVDTIKSVAPKFPDWSFNMIGSSKLGEIDNQKSYAQKILKKFKDIGKQANFYGFKNKNFVEKKMKSGSIIIIPSLWQEPFGLVAAEAMSNGIAIIAANSGGIPEIVGKNGILINDINYSKLKRALIDLLSNSEKRIMYQHKSWINFKFSSACSSEKLDNFRKIIFQKFD
jgi:glycosyltransferase involved in cell wall biosynthesis